MRKLTDKIRHRIPANSRFAKTLSIIYFVWLAVIIDIIVNTYGNGHHHVSSGKGYFILLISLLSWIIPMLIGLLHEGIYTVLYYGGGQRQRQAYLAKLDERQRDTRRRIFEKSYAVIATLALFSVLGVEWFGNGLPQDGGFYVAINLTIFVISLPSIVATWDKESIFKPVD
jgi:hypothetical protein